MANHLLSRHLLRQLTLIYLAVPVAIFFLGWLRLPLALLTTGLLAWTCWRTGWRRKKTEHETMRLSLVALLLGGVLPSLVFVALSGAGGWGSGDSDWYKHDTILFDLIQRSWPVTYQTSAGPALLVYYVAFYLPAALVGKWTGSWMLASQALALTMFVGILLSLGWLALLGRRGEEADAQPPLPRTGWWWRAVVVFFCFSGLDAVGKLGVNLYLHLPAFDGDWYDVAWWAQAFQYPSNAAALFWAPHQAIGAWLPCALVLESAWQADRAGGDFSGSDNSEHLEGPSALPLALAWSWSPFAAIGLAPVFAGLVLFGGPGQSTTFIRRLSAAICSPVNLGAAALTLLTTGFYAARLTPFALPAVARVPPGRSPAPLITEGLMPMPLLYLVFVVLEFGLLAAALWWAFSDRPRSHGPMRASRREDQLLLIAATSTLLLLPMVHYGYANDLVMRGGLPALFVLQVLVARAFTQKPERGFAWALVAVVALLALGASNTFLEYRRHVDRMWRDQSWRDVARDDLAAKRQGQPLPAWSLFELQRGIYNRPGFDFARQYLGSTESFYQHHLAPSKQATPQPVHE